MVFEIARLAPGTYVQRVKAHPYAAAAGTAVALLALSAIVNARLAKKAERDNPPSGQFIDIDGVRLHYVEHGRGDPLVLLHGNGSMIQDFQSSGLIDLAAQRHRVIVFDRPGYGHSDRPRGRVWTADAQADLFYHALRALGVTRPIVLGHSWGASVALSLAAKYPDAAGAVVLASGYYYPTPRLDVAALSPPAIPIIGDLIRHTVAPLVSRLMWPALLRKMFGPANVPGKFAGFPKEMTFRPSQIRASAAESALMVPQTIERDRQYRQLQTPAVIIAGEDDRLIDIEGQSARLHRDVPRSALRRIPGTGHMVHQTATVHVMAAIDEAASMRTQTPISPSHGALAEAAA
jgi:pimeloyl-ACP methyl ester carboxylesterase